MRLADIVPNVNVFLDLDGTVADFDKRVKEITGYYPDEFGAGKPAGGRNKMFKAMAMPQYDFYNSLDWLPDGEFLFKSVEELSPIVLTGLPMGHWAAPQKRKWVARMMGAHIPIITCLADEKPIHALKFLQIHRGLESNNLEGAILIDDREKTKAMWEGLGGVYILHKNAQQSLKELNDILEFRSEK